MTIIGQTVVKDRRDLTITMMGRVQRRMVAAIVRGLQDPMMEVNQGHRDLTMVTMVTGHRDLTMVTMVGRIQMMEVLMTRLRSATLPAIGTEP